jgi:acyl-CoA synthetase (NDP forming)/GNAT superfamily N-acetyltransferase
MTERQGALVADDAPTRALLADGRVAAIRPLGPDDGAALARLHRELPERDRYLRFFTPYLPPTLDRLVRQMATGDAHRLGLGAFLGDTLVGVAHFEVLAEPDEAEVALAVDHVQQAHGVGTLLLEHLASAARERGVRRFVAEVLAENAAMLRVFRDCGLPVETVRDGASCQVTLRLDSDYPAEVRERERSADVASLRAALRPTSVAVVGAGRRRGSIGNALLRNILDGGYTGALHVVNPHADAVEGVPAVHSVDDLPSDVDLAVLCVPAEAVPEVARQCGRRGVRALLVVSSGLTGEDTLSGGVVAAAREYGMRLVGPNCLGLVNTDQDVRLNATFARGLPPAGRVGVVTQSGGVGIALLEQFASVGLGVSTLVSTGDKYDVSGNDLLLWWLRDRATDVAVLHLESFGNPRKFARLARALSAETPVLTVRTGNSEAGGRAAASHTAAVATPVATRDALFAQAGVLAVDTLTELVAAVCVLSWQPLPAGDRVAIVSNAGGAGVLAADACAAAGLTLPDLSEPTLATLRALVPAHAGIANPLDTTAGVSDDTFATCLRAVLDDPAVDSVLVIAAPTAVSDPASVVGPVLAGTTKPAVVVRAGQSAAVQPMPTGDGSVVPAFADPAVAVDALATATRHARWRQRPPGVVPDLPGIDVAAARAVCRDHLAAHPDGGWLGPAEVTAMLGHMGLPVLPGSVVTDVDGALGAAAGFGVPVALKAVTHGVLHKSRAGGLALDVRTPDEVRAAFAIMRERFGERLVGVLVQPMAAPGRELLVGVAGDDTFGPLVVLGLGGVDAELVADRTCRLVPLTDTDAAGMVGALRGSALMFDTDAVEVRDQDRAAVVDVLLRVGRLAELVPEIAEADLNPVIVRDGRCVVPDARVRVRPSLSTDPYLRRLRG